MLELVKHRRSSAAANRSLAASVIQQHRQEEEGGVEHENTSVFDLGSASEDDEEVFAPEAEGTPVLLDKKKTRVSGSARKSVQAARSDANASAVKRNKRKSGDVEDSSHSALDALRKKHRKSEPSHVEDKEEVHLPEVDHSVHSAGHVLPDHQSSPVPDRTASEVQVINSSPQHSSPLTSPASSCGFPGPAEADFTVPSTEEQERARTNLDNPEDEDEDEADSPDVANATMAEPASSSPITSPIPETQRTDVYADPLTQASPSPAREPARTRSQNTNNNVKKKQPASLSTAKLRTLLPRRTQKPQPRPRRTEYDISSDSDDEDDDGTALGTTNLEDDEDEDDFRNSRSRRQTKTATQSKSSKKKPTTASTRAKSKPALPPTRSKSKATTRQYGRAAAAAASASDKENAGEEPQDDEEGGGEDTTLTMKDLAHSRELEEARRKFAEVDEWDLSFESMSNEDHRSSSQNWR